MLYVMKSPTIIIGQFLQIIFMDQMQLIFQIILEMKNTRNGHRMEDILHFVIFTISVFGPLIIVYDFPKKYLYERNLDGGLVDSEPKWTANSKLYFAYQSPIGSTTLLIL